MIFDGIEQVKEKFLGPASSSHLLYYESDSSKLLAVFVFPSKCSRQVTTGEILAYFVTCQRCEQTEKYPST